MSLKSYEINNSGIYDFEKFVTDLKSAKLTDEDIEQFWSIPEISSKRYYPKSAVRHDEKVWCKTYLRKYAKRIPQREFTLDFLKYLNKVAHSVKKTCFLVRIIKFLRMICPGYMKKHEIRGGC